MDDRIKGYSDQAMKRSDIVSVLRLTVLAVALVLGDCQNGEYQGMAGMYKPPD